MHVKKYTERFEIRLSPQELTRLMALSIKLHESLAHTLRICLNDYWDLKIGFKNGKKSTKR
jgi:hypothetical protein